MSLHPYFFPIAAVVLALALAFLWRRARGSFTFYAEASDGETSVRPAWDPLTSQLSARIFSQADSDFVSRASTRRISQSFRAERTALALQWLLEVRRHVYFLMRAHRRAARRDPDLDPVSELRLGIDFLLFQVTSRILYLVIWLIGPLHAAALVGYSLKLAAALRNMTEDLVTSGTRVAADLLDNESETKNRAASI